MNQPLHKNPAIWTAVALVLVIVVSFIIWSGSKRSAATSTPLSPGSGPDFTLNSPPGNRGSPGANAEVPTNASLPVGRRGGGGGNRGGTPVDRTAFDDQIKARQRVKDTTNEITVDLKPWINSALTDPLMGNDTNVTLADLPVGTHIYAGVPFDVQGLVRLAGMTIPADGSMVSNGFPSQVAGIKIARKLTKLHLFHGAMNGANNHPLIAKVVLHFADGSRQELALNAGSQLLMCYGPYDPSMLPPVDAPRTELGWVDASPYIRQNRPNAGLHVYRTSFDNPKPEVEVATIDYVSSFAASAFLAGLTIE